MEKKEDPPTTLLVGVVGGTKPIGVYPPERPALSDDDLRALLATHVASTRSRASLRQRIQRSSCAVH
jgi:hypothetical protein